MNPGAESVICEVCGDLVEADKYQAHFRRKHVERPLKHCPLCQKTFTSPSQLQYHLAHHQNARMFTCDECPKRFNTPSDLAAHQNLHDKTKDPIPCPECGLFFQFRTKLKTHMRSHRKAKEPKVEPKRLKQETAENVSPIREPSEVKKELNAPHEPQPGPVQHSTTPPQTPFKCSQCGLVFDIWSKLKAHVKTHKVISDDKCSVCAPISTKLGTHNLLVQCRKCGNSYGSTQLESDMQYDENDIPFKCGLRGCGKVFANKYRLSRHTAANHMNQCVDCWKNFASLNTLLKHEKVCRVKQSIEDGSRDNIPVKVDPAIANESAIELERDKPVDEPEDDIWNDDNNWDDSDHSSFADIKPDRSLIEIQPKNHSTSIESVMVPIKLEPTEQVFVNDVKEECFGYNECSPKKPTSGNKRQCQVCKVNFTSERACWSHAIASHIIGHHCAICFSDFGSNLELYLHMKGDHSVEIKHDDEQHLAVLAPQPNVKKFNNRDKMKCQICRKQFRSIEQAKSHVIAFHVIKHHCAICKNNFSSMLDLNRHMQDYHNIQFIINAKQRLTQQRGKLRDKLAIQVRPKVVQEKERLSCSDCGRSFKHQFSLNFHIRTVHLNNTNPESKESKAKTSAMTGVKKFTCDYCGRVVLKKQQLLTHILAIHCEKSFECEICSKKFSFKQTRDNHVRSQHFNQRKHNCQFCKKGFTMKQQLDFHVARHHDDDPDAKKKYELACEFCGKIVHKKQQLQLHILSAHTEKTVECEHCDRKFSYEALKQRHVSRVHLNERPYECSYCKKTFTLRKGWKRHVEYHHTIGPEAMKKHKCTLCDKMFIEVWGMKKHIQTFHHNIKTKQRYSRCQLCRETIINSFQLRRHFSLVHDEGARPMRQCQLCNLEFQLYDDFKEHIDSHPESLICLICGISAPDQDALEFHQSTHIVKLKFSCDVCGRKYQSKNSLSTHVRVHMTSADFYFCEVCGKTFKFRPSYVYHMKSHAQQRDHVCGTCGKAYILKHELIVHMRIHTNELPYSCEICGKAVNSKQHLKVHQQSHEETRAIHECKKCGLRFENRESSVSHIEAVHPEKRPFWCHICKQSFSREHQLNQHLKFRHVQISLTCKICGRECESRSKFKEHSKRHHVCKVCDLPFESKAQLIDHEEREHPERRPYRCPLCQNSFTKEAQVLQHCKFKHKEVQVIIEKGEFSVNYLNI